MRRRLWRTGAWATLTLTAACGRWPGGVPAASPRPLGGPPSVHVVYPPLVSDSSGWHAASPIASRDSAFVFGSVRRPDATVEVNGVAVPVAPTGGWIAWLPLPDDTVAWFTVVAAVGDTVDSLVFRAALPQRFAPPADGPWVDTTSLAPTGTLWREPGEGVRLTVRAAPAARVLLELPDSSTVPFVPDTARPPASWGEQAFGTVPRPTPAMPQGRYALWWTGALGSDPGPVLGVPGPPDTAAAAWVAVIVGDDTVRARWPLRVGVLDPQRPTVAIVNDDTAGTGTTDRTLAGRPAPNGTYYWFFPNGTRAVVEGRWNGQVRLRLSARSAAWVDAVDVQPLPAGTPPLRGTMLPLRLFPGASSLTLRVPLPGRVPFRVDEAEQRLTLTLYGVAPDADWIQYGGTDSLIRLIRFAAPVRDETQVLVDLARPVWGYRTRWAGNDLLLEIRRPPVIDRRHPLRGRVIALDAGHPPLGATGPTGAYEADVVLAVARRAQAMLERAGARVVQIRPSGAPLGLIERTAAAEAADADVLISIHANALPDGVNPFVNNGTSTYYFHPRSAPLARAVQRALVRALGVRDLGMGRGDLALVRPTWMPAVLTEGLFMMIPEQEEMLTSAEGQERYARGIVEGVTEFLTEWSRRP
jgi:N-acetylmuramoyl-L-alanine amidase